MVGALLLLVVSGQVLYPMNPEGPIFGRPPDASLLRILPTSGGAPGGECSGTAITGTRGEAVTFARTSSAYCTKSDGTMVLLTANQPRVSLISGAPMLLVEGAATNLLLRSQEFNSGSWLVAGTAGSPAISADSADVTDPLGTNTAEKIVFPAVNAGQTSVVYQQFATGAAAYSGAVYLRSASGTFTIPVSFTTVGNSFSQQVTVTTSWQRLGPTNKTLSAAAWYFVLGYDGAAGGEITTASALPQASNTVYVWQADAQQSAFITSPIATAGTTQTRTLETATVPTPAGWDTSTFCYGAKIQPIGSAWSLNAGIIQTNTADVANAVRSFLNGSAQFFHYDFTGAGAAKTFTSTAAVTATAHDLIAIWSAGTPSAKQDGAAFAGAVGGAGSGIVGTHAATVYLGGASGTSLNGHIGNIRLANGASGCDR